MSETAEQRRRRILMDFFVRDVKAILETDQSDSEALTEIMIIIQNLLTGTLRMMTGMFHLPPEKAADIIDECLNQALKSFTKPGKGKKP